MGFLDKLKSIFFGLDYDKEIRDLSKRIAQLNAEKGKADVELELLKKKIVTIPNFEIKPFETKKIEVKSFTSPKLHPVRTMKDLMQERRHQLQLQVAKNLDAVRVFIDAEDPDSAEGLLFSISPELKDGHLNNKYKELLCDIENLRKRLNSEHLEAETKQRAAEEAKKLEIERLTTLVTSLKEDADSILQYLKENGITRFYHFTDEQNLIHIKQFGGLYSWHYCGQNGIKIPNPGGDSDSRKYDTKHGLQDYVRLSFCNDHPMAYRKYQEGASLSLLYIDMDVAAFKDTLFTDRNAASNSFACGGSYEDLMKVDISATQRNYVSRDEGEVFSLHQAECMIKTFIPLKYISNIDNPRKMSFK